MSKQTVYYQIKMLLNIRLRFTVFAILTALLAFIYRQNMIKLLC